MGAVTIANKVQGRSSNGRQKIVECDVTLSASYATAGDTVAIGSLGLKGVEVVQVSSHHLITGKAVATTSSRAGLSVELGGTKVAPKLLVYDAQGVEATAATNFAARGPIRVRFLGF